VKSAVIRLTRNSRLELGCDEKLFFNVVKTAFNQRRKTLSNSIKGLLNGKPLNHAFFSKRAEQLSVDNFIELTNQIQKIIKE
jgi:16S rRNA (adenine1518-N6/adenine1519-N6)-dimethyltransferase